MVCATSNMTMNKRQEEEEDEFDMAMDEDDDSEEESSQDEAPPKRPVTQALFLNFTSDLSPQKTNKKKSKPKKQTAYRVNGVNILNRNNLDSKTAIERIQRRRENHNHVERRRRDNINNTIFELSSVVPNAIQPGQKPNKGNILKLSLDYIRDLQAENNALKERLNPSSMSPATVTVTPPAMSPTMTQPLMHPSLAADEIFPSAPNSPSRFVQNTIFTQSTSSVPSSPNTKEDGIFPPPLVLPPPQQQLQNGFSKMSVSSNSSSAASTPTNNNFYTQSIHIPQPPQLYNHHQVFNTQQPQQHKQQGLRPLLPATSFLPALRMGGYEKIYGNVCRY